MQNHNPIVLHPLENVLNKNDMDCERDPNKSYYSASGVAGKNDSGIGLASGVSRAGV
jgi:hypothetical protein